MAKRETRERKIMTLSKMGEYLVLRIPKEYQERLDLKPRDKVVVELRGRRLIVYRVA